MGMRIVQGGILLALVAIAGLLVSIKNSMQSPSLPPATPAAISQALKPEEPAAPAAASQAAQPLPSTATSFNTQAAPALPAAPAYAAPRRSHSEAAAPRAGTSIPRRSASRSEAAS